MHAKDSEMTRQALRKLDQYCLLTVVRVMK
jgi:hypothetical protein